eukprot:COSAG02_NODE_67004_length_254_cov_0.651613_1_plen_74_part_01
MRHYRFEPGDEVQASRMATINSGDTGWDCAEVLEAVDNRGYLVRWTTGNPDYDTVLSWSHVRRLADEIPDMSYY